MLPPLKNSRDFSHARTRGDRLLSDSKKAIQEIISDAKSIALKLGKIPTAFEIQYHSKFSDRQIRKHFGGYEVLLRAAGLRKEPEEKGNAKFKYLPAKLEGFNRFRLDLAELFEKAGNPPSLKMVELTDVHWEHRHQEAWAVALKFLKWYKPHVLAILGDFLDAKGITHWPAEDTKARRIMPEVKSARGGLYELSEATQSVIYRFYCEGNHEDWINQAIAQKLPELFDDLDEDLEINLKKLLHLEQLGIHLFPLNAIVQLGKANFTHGIYTNQHHAAKHLAEFKDNIYYGHIHDSQAHDGISMDGPLESRSLGCLCKDAKFMKGKPNKWVRSFGIHEFFPDGTYTFLCPKIINGRMSFAGRVFSA